MAREHPDLFEELDSDDADRAPSSPAATPPEGFRYRPAVLSAVTESRLLEALGGLPFRNFEFHGFVGKRRVVSYGWRYDFSQERVEPAAPIPDFLLGVRDEAATFAGLAADRLLQILVTEYQAGASIGWHRDKAVFGDVIGISLLSPCTFRLRRKSGTKWQRYAVIAEPRSAYLMTGPSRTEWEHSIPAVPSRRYSITFRTLRDDKARDVRLHDRGGSVP